MAESVLFPTLAAKKGAKCVLLAPVPRYLFVSCCGNKSHWPNIEQQGYQEKSYKIHITVLRNILIKSVNGYGIQNTRVIDSCAEFTNTDNIQTRLDKLSAVTSTDGTHYTREGYKNMDK
jgi:hypothetical protein